MMGGSARAVVANTADSVKIKMAGTAARPNAGTGYTADGEALRGRGRGRSGLWLCDHGCGRFVAAFLVGALPGDTGALQVFLDHVVRAARRARLQDDFVPCCELTFRIAAASEEKVAAAAATVEDFGLFAFRAGDASLDRVAFHTLECGAMRI